MSLKNNLQCVLLDLYGTLLDVRVNQDSPEFWTRLSNQLAIRRAFISPSSLESLFASILKEELQKGSDGFVMHSVFQRFLSSTGVDLSVDEFAHIFREFSVEELRLRSYTPKLLSLLRNSGCSIGIVSNTEATLTRYDLSKYPILYSVDTLLLSSEIGFKKPDSEIFEIALAQLNADPEFTVFIGDNLTDDVQGASDAGLRSIFLTEKPAKLPPELSVRGTVLPSFPSLEAITSALRTFGLNTRD